MKVEWSSCGNLDGVPSIFRGASTLMGLIKQFDIPLPVVQVSGTGALTDDLSNAFQRADPTLIPGFATKMTDLCQLPSDKMAVCVAGAKIVFRMEGGLESCELVFEGGATHELCQFAESILLERPIAPFVHCEDLEKFVQVFGNCATQTFVAPFFSDVLGRALKMGLPVLGELDGGEVRDVESWMASLDGS
jgi:hypothetical protein